MCPGDGVSCTWAAPDSGSDCRDRKNQPLQDCPAHRPPNLILEGSPTLSAPLHFGDSPPDPQHRWLQDFTLLVP